MGAPAAPVHLAHGDAEGACAEEEEPEGDGGEEAPEDEGQEDAATGVVVCHVPPGNPENPITIEVGESAVLAHLAHRDTEGACAGDETPEETGEPAAEG